MKKLLWGAFLLLVWPQIEKRIKEKMSGKPTAKSRKAKTGKKRSTKARG